MRNFRQLMNETLGTAQCKRCVLTIFVVVVGRREPPKVPILSFSLRISHDDSFRLPFITASKAINALEGKKAAKAHFTLLILILVILSKVCRFLAYRAAI